MQDLSLQKPKKAMLDGDNLMEDKFMTCKNVPNRRAGVELFSAPSIWLLHT